MMVKHKVLILTLALLTLGFAKANAEQSLLRNNQLVSEKSLVEVDETTGVLANITENNELTVTEFFKSDSSFIWEGYLNFTYQSNVSSDSANYKGIQIYLKQVIPVIKNMKTQEIEMIEIL